MTREDLADFLLQKVGISASQEELLNAIPGWEEIGGIIDDTPSQQSPSQSSQQRIFDVTGSSVSDDQDLSQKAVEWASPEQTPIAHSKAAIGSQSYQEAFESDRSQSPKRRLSWGLSRRGDVSSPESDRPDSPVKAVSDGATEALLQNKNASAGTSTAALPVMGKPHGPHNDLEGERREENVEPWGQPLPSSPAPQNERSVSLPRHSDPVQEDSNVKKRSYASKIVGDSSERQKSSCKVGCPNDGRVCVRTLDDSTKANKEGDDCKPQVDSRDVAVVSSGKSLKAASSDSEGEKRVEAPMPSKAVQEKLRNLRRLGSENAAGIGSRKRGRGEEETLHVPNSVMDVVKQMSDGEPAPMVSAAELLSAALRAGSYCQYGGRH